MQLLLHVPQQVGVGALHNGQRARLYAGSVSRERGEGINVVRTDIRPRRVQTTAMGHEEKP